MSLKWLDIFTPESESFPFREVTKHIEVLEPFCNGPKTEVALINAVQVYCYEESRVMKAFPQILKVGIFLRLS